MGLIASSIAPLLLFTYAVAGCAVFLALQRFARLRGDDVPAMFWVSLGAGPAVISLITIVSVRVAPGTPPLFHVLLVEAILAGLTVLGWRERHALVQVADDLAAGIRALRRWTWLERLVAALLLLVLLAIWLFALVLPVAENDALQYVLVSRMFYERETLAFYPVIQADPQTGFYAVSSHPLGYMGVYLWSYMAQGDAVRLTAVKLVSPAYVTYTLIAFAALNRQRPRLVWLLAGLLLVTTPVYFIQTGDLSIDSFRMYLLLAAGGWVLVAARAASLANPCTWIAGVFCGLSMYSHSINLILTVPLLGAGYLLVARGSLGARVAAGTAIAVCATVVGGERIFSNLLQFGMPVYDFLPVYDLPFMHRTEHVWGEAGMLLPWEQVWFGVLRGWTDLRSYGASYWILALAGACALLGWPVRGWAGRPEAMYATVCVLMCLVAAATVAVGSPAFVTNARYLMTVQPFVASLGAVFLVALHTRALARA